MLLSLAVLAVSAACQSQAELPLLTNTAPSPTLEEMDDSGNGYGAFSFVQVGKINLNKLSGIVFHLQRKTLFGVGDQGHVIEFEPDGTIVQQELVRRGADFEGITCNPATGLLYIAVEGDEVILEIEPDKLQVLRDIPIERVFEGQILLHPRGNGVEGITFVPTGDGATSGSFYLVNQSNDLGGRDPSIVFQVEVTDLGEPQAKIVRYFTLGVTDLSGIHYDPSSRQLLIISDDNDLLLETSLSGQISHVRPLPGADQEGITIDERGFLYIAQDSAKGLLKFTPSGPEF
jgi:uncharacterized protein YjiK